MHFTFKYLDLWFSENIYRHLLMLSTQIIFKTTLGTSCKYLQTAIASIKLDVFPLSPELENRPTGMYWCKGWKVKDFFKTLFIGHLRHITPNSYTLRIKIVPGAVWWWAFKPLWITFTNLLIEHHWQKVVDIIFKHNCEILC